MNMLGYLRRVLSAIGIWSGVCCIIAFGEFKLRVWAGRPLKSVLSIGLIATATVLTALVWRERATAPGNGGHGDAG